ncbi:MAG: phosphatidylglycerol lysyltransferase domain-containing protein [Treponemataceae bacterium]|nr:MAG: phosphatidylglycerol lysyltransferase domain-containing protein [Treponemataceae bacterium]
MGIPFFPNFVSVTLELAGELAPFCAALPYSACEFPFAAIYLHRNKYAYSVSRLTQEAYVLKGVEPEGAASGRDGKPFFSVLGNIDALVSELGAQKLQDMIYSIGMWKTFPGALNAAAGEAIVSSGAKSALIMVEDRNNFDYLYLRSDLAALSGKKFHKKKNLVNAFFATYPNVETRALDTSTKSDALRVLDAWRKSRPDDADYAECAQAIDLLAELDLSGVVAYVDGTPAAFSLGERIAQNTTYCVHFEKGVESCKGIFQFINQAQAQSLDETITYINREQDTGDEGLRQAKLTYRPCAFFEKYLILPQSEA